MRRAAIGLAGFLIVVFQAVPALGSEVMDTDLDLVDDTVDNCIGVANPLQGDLDGDGIGDLCDDDAIISNDFEGTTARDLVVGTDEASTLAGGTGGDALYGSGGDDTLDGGPGRDFLVGGAGDDILTGGTDCDVFGFDPTEVQADTVTDFRPGLDRFAFFPQNLDPTLDILPEHEFGGDEHLTMTFTVDGQETTIIEFEGLAPGVSIDLDTSPCGQVGIPDSDPGGDDGSSDDPGDDPDDPPCQWTGSFDGQTLVLTGSDCDDSFPPSGTNRILDGGEGDDTAQFISFGPLIGFESYFGVPAGLGAGAPLGFSWSAGSVIAVDIFPYDGEDATTTLIGIEFVMFDALGETPTTYVLVVGTDEVDALVGVDDMRSLILGFAGDDHLTGGNASDVLIAGAGDDIVYASGGFDIVLGDDAVIDTGTGGNDDIHAGPDGSAISGDSIFLSGSAVGGDDTLTGNAGFDAISGDAFVLTDDAAGGNDQIAGGAGDDILTGDAYAMQGNSVGGIDTIKGGDGADLISGDTNEMDDAARGGNDKLSGGNGDDEIGGDSGWAMRGTSVGGADTIYGDAGNDILYGDAGGDMWDLAMGGDDVIDGGEGDDEIYGDAGNWMSDTATGGDDTIDGGAGNDTIFGDAEHMDVGTTAGDDTITGGTGDDDLYGDAATMLGTGGADLFVFDVSTVFGADVIHDPNVGGVGDTIEFTNHGGVDIDTRSVVTDDGTDVVGVIYRDPLNGVNEEIGRITLLGLSAETDVVLDSWQKVDEHTLLTIIPIAASG